MHSNVAIPLLIKFLCALLIGLYPATAAGQVVAGDIVIIRVNNGGTTGTDSFTWLALNDLVSPELHWTDGSWGSAVTNGRRHAWQHVEDSSGGGTSWLPSGTILAGTTGEVTLAAGLAPADQLFIYTGKGPFGNGPATEETTNFLYGMTFGEPWVTSGGITNSKSYEPETIRNLGVSVSLGVGTHWYYTGTTTGTATQLLVEIRNPENWTVTDDNTKHSWAEMNGANFDVLVPEPSTYAFAAGVCGLLVALRKRRSAQASA